MNDISDYTNDIHQGDAADTLAEIPDSSVHMVMTSPPYFGLRDYGHENQIGLEDELDAYIEELVGVFREVRRVLRPDGSAWLNLGDSYAGGGGMAGVPDDHESKTVDHSGDGQPDESPLRSTSFGRKNKMLVPHRVAIALQDDGWVVRNDVTWVKPNPMPSSVKDRLNTTTEQIFHLTPNPDYWYDLDAIREPYQENTKARAERGLAEGHKLEDSAPGQSKHSIHQPADEQGGLHPAGKNPGDVFEVTTKPFPEAHFAVYPPELVETPLKATCPPTVCAECGSPYEREVERTTYSGEYGIEDEEATKTREEAVEEHKDNPDGYGSAKGRNLGGRQYRKWKRNNPDEFKGWTPTCDCDTDATEAGIALDPFAGAGTTLLKAKELGRKFVGIELNAKYADMARARVGIDVHNPANIRGDDNQSGLEAYE